MRALGKRETEMREKIDESAAKDEEIHHLQQELEHEQVCMDKHNCRCEVYMGLCIDHTCIHTTRVTGLGPRNNFNI